MTHIKECTHPPTRAKVDRYCIKHSNQRSGCQLSCASVFARKKRTTNVFKTGFCFKQDTHTTWDTKKVRTLQSKIHLLPEVFLCFAAQKTCGSTAWTARHPEWATIVPVVRTYSKQSCFNSAPKMTRTREAQRKRTTLQSKIHLPAFCMFRRTKNIA